MAKDFDEMENSNRSANPSIHEVSDPARRLVLHGGLAALAGGVLPAWLGGCAISPGEARATVSGPLLSFKGIPTASNDTLVVPEGYVADV
ncbi:MAG: PhoX family phosphatase, partial [Pseudomonadota bacterium]